MSPITVQTHCMVRPNLGGVMDISDHSQILKQDNRMEYKKSGTQVVSFSKKFNLPMEKKKVYNVHGGRMVNYTLTTKRRMVEYSV